MKIIFFILFCVALLLAISIFALSVLRIFLDVAPDLQEYVADFRDRHRKPNIIEWNPGETMSKDFAIGVIEDIQQFYRRLYFQPQMSPFHNEVEFEGALKVLEGLKEFISQNEENYK